MQTSGRTAARVAVLMAVGLIAGCTGGGTPSGTPIASQPAESASAAQSPAADLPTVTWTGGTSFATADHWAYVLYNELADGVSECTGGRFTINNTLLGELGIESSEFLPALDANRIQLAEIFTGASSGRIPVFGVFGLPFLISGPEDAATVGEAVHDASSEELGRFGTTPIAEYVFPGVHLWSSKELADVTDWAGLKVRTFDDLSTATVDRLGGQGIVMNGAEAYEGIQRGVVEGGLTSTGSALSFSWQEVAPHGYLLSISFPYVYIGVSTEAFDALPEEYQACLMEEAERIEPRFVEEFEAADAGSNDEWVSEGGDLYEPTSSEKSAIQDKVRPLWDDWRESVGSTEGAALDAAISALGN